MIGYKDISIDICLWVGGDMTTDTWPWLVDWGAPSPWRFYYFLTSLAEIFSFSYLCIQTTDQYPSFIPTGHPIIVVFIPTTHTFLFTFSTHPGILVL